MKTKLLALVVIVFALAGFWFSGLMALQWGKEQANYYYGRVTDYFTRTEIVRVPVEVESKTIAQLVKQAQTNYGVPKMILMSMIEQESGGKFKTNRVRFEPGVYNLVNKKNFRDEEVGRLWASSIGLMQVIPHYHLTGKSAPECNLEYQELFDPEKNINCGAAIMARCLKNKAAIEDKDQRFRACLKEYNGAETYPAEVMGRIYKLAIEGAL